MDNYYERYWQKKDDRNSNDNVTGMPPKWHKKDLDRILGCLSGITMSRVLDIGCGNGYLAHIISNLNGVKDISGVDISETAIKQAGIDYPNINFSVGDSTSLNFPDGYFDSVFAIEVLEHIVDVGLVISEVNRVLKKGGYFIITTTDFNLLKKIIVAAFFFDRYFYPTNPHIRFFNKRTLSDILTKNGFSVFRHKWHGSYMGLMPKGQILIAKK